MVQIILPVCSAMGILHPQKVLKCNESESLVLLVRPLEPEYGTSFVKLFVFPHKVVL